MLYVIYYSNKEFTFEIDWNFIYKALLSSTIMSLLIYWFNPTNNIETIYTLILAILTYFFALLLLDSFNEKENEIIRSIIRIKK